MYHCGLRFYFAGQSCRVFEIIREMPPLERFTHEFSESGKLDGALAAEADVIFANLQDMDVETDVRGLFAGKSGETEVILLAAEGQMAAYRHDGFWSPMDNIHDRDYLEGLWSSGQAPWKERHRYA